MYGLRVGRNVCAQQFSGVWDERSAGIRWAANGDGSGAGMRALGAVTLLAAVLAGCGGGQSGPTAKEKRAALDKWTRTADAACEKANKSIAKRAGRSTSSTSTG